MSADVLCYPPLPPSHPLLEGWKEIRQWQDFKGAPSGPTLNRPAGHTQHTHTVSISSSSSPPHTQTHTPVLCTRISRWLHSSQIRSIFHPSKNHPSLFSLFTGGHSHSRVTAINHPSMWNDYTNTEKTQYNCTVISPKLPPDHHLASVLWNLFPTAWPPSGPLSLSFSITMAIAPSWLQTSHHLSPHCDSVTWFITQLVALSHICRNTHRQTHTSPFTRVHA